MIRLIACDIDGTLLQDGQQILPPEIYPLICQLEERGVDFCAASGRQFSNLYRLFGPLADRIHYVCENGALVFRKGNCRRPLRKLHLPEGLARDLAADIMARPECEILLSGPDISYLMPKDPEVLPLIRTYLGSQVAVISRPEEIIGGIVQISAFCRPDTERAYAALAPRWGQRINVAVAGRNWIDFSLAHKGLGLEILCGALEIPPEQVMAFGDNFNDVPMLDLAGHPVIMETAAQSLQTRYAVRCRDVAETLRSALETGAL